MAVRPSTRKRSRIESLETRRLMADVSILNYGAVPNSGIDNSAAIQAAINASQPGDTIVFPAGVYNLGSSVNPIGDGRILKSEGAVLQTTTKDAAFHFSGNGLTVTGFTFRGQGIFADTPTGKMVENLTVTKNNFDVTGQYGNGVEFTTGLRNSQISNNRFTTSAGGDNGIYGYYWENLTISDNSFVNGNEGIHVTDQADVSHNLVIERNYFSGLHRMGIEYQGGGTNTIVQDNFYEKPSMTSNFDDNAETFAYSIIADRSHGTIVRRNTSIAPERPDGVGVRIVFEIGGDGTIVEDNYSVGGNHVLASNDGLGGTSVLAQNNLWLDYIQGAGGNGLTLVNNGPDVQLTWDINRPRPGPDGEVLPVFFSAVIPEPTTTALAIVVGALALKRPAIREDDREAGERKKKVFSNKRV